MNDRLDGFRIIGLKTDPSEFNLTVYGGKRFEIRYNDRDYRVGDILLLKETESSGKEMEEDGHELVYTGKTCFVKVTHIMTGPLYGLKEGWVIMSVEGPVFLPKEYDNE